MVKHLTKKGYTFWYRRRMGKKGEIVFSLATKNYDLAILRHSYIDYKINQLILKGAIETMNTAKIREIIDGYTIESIYPYTKTTGYGKSTHNEVDHLYYVQARNTKGETKTWGADTGNEMGELLEYLTTKDEDE